jgi:DNA-binding transcriptional MerR regulator
MIRTYSVAELEEMSGISRRTISDYIAKGIMAGPSHRGRGARYSQTDADALRVLPRVRTLLRKEYPTLKSVSDFLRLLSASDLRRLVRRTTTVSFIGEMRRLRVRNALMAMLPHVPPERIEEQLNSLTPGQIRGVDAERYQIGAVLDIEALWREEASESDQAEFHPQMAEHENKGSGHGNINGHAAEPSSNGHAAEPSSNGHAAEPSSNGHAAEPSSNGHAAEPSIKACSTTVTPYWSVNWLNGHEKDNSSPVALQPDDVISVQALRKRMEEKAADTATDLASFALHPDDTQPELKTLDAASVADEPETVADEPEINLERRLSEIAQRLQRLEIILEDERSKSSR